MSWESNVTMGLSALAAFGSLYTYLVHNRKLNKQQKQINEQVALLNNYQLEKNKEEENNKKKALIEANVVPYFNGRHKSWKIKIYNKGVSKASNISLISDDLQNDAMITLLRIDELLPYPSLVPQQSFEIYVRLCSGYKSIYRIKLVWDDDFGEKQYQEQDLSF